MALVLTFAAGLALGLLWRSHQASAAEDRARQAELGYRTAVARETLVQHERDAFDSIRARALAAADSAQRAADSSVAAIRARAAGTTARAGAALAQAVSLRDTADTYRTLYTEAAGQRDDALEVAEQQKRVTGRLLAIVARDSVALRLAWLRGDSWKVVADSLHLANADLLKHRRPTFDVKLGLGGAAVGAVIVGGVCLLTPAC